MQDLAINSGSLVAPRHLAIIMDGNGRWAQMRGKQRVFGHKEGANAVRRVITASAKMGVKELTLFAFSSENWKRPKLEVSALMTLFSEYIKKEADSDITMIIVRDDEEMSFTLHRGSVEIPVIATKVYEVNGKKVGYLSISLFSSVSAKQFKNKLEKLEDEGIDSLVIDVRDNNGGYLSSVTDIASYLLPRGKKIYQIQKNDDREVTKDKTLAKREYPIAILVNGNSASASEILAGVIKESYGGFVVGTKTYGKGTVQQVKKLSDGSMIKYTVENWLTPDGNWIDGVGIEPTDYVELSEGYINNPIEDNDNQLKKALELVSK